MNDGFLPIYIGRSLREKILQCNLFAIKHRQDAPHSGEQKSLIFQNVRFDN